MDIKRMTDFFTIFMEKQYYKIIFEGLQNTIILSLVATLIGLVIGVLVAMVQSLQVESNNKFLQYASKIAKIFAKIYVGIIRGTPVVVQLMFLWSVVFASFRLDRILIGALAFGINSGAYMSEIIRGGILAIDKGQMEAGRSLGLSYTQSMKIVILPQAIRQMLPALVNEFIVLIKETSVIGFIGGMDLMRASDVLISTTYNAEIPLTMVAIIYLILTTVLTGFVKIIEKKLR